MINIFIITIIFLALLILYITGSNAMYASQL